MKHFVLTLFTTSMIAACSGSQSASPATGAPPSGGGSPATSTDSPRSVCVASMHRERDCADDYLRETVALRVRLDRPAGIAARDQSEGRPALVAAARQEFTADSADGAIDQTCDRVGAMPADQVGPMIESIRHCLATTSCHDFVACDIPVIEHRLSAPAPETH